MQFPTVPEFSSTPRVSLQRRTLCKSCEPVLSLRGRVESLFPKEPSFGLVFPLHDNEIQTQGSTDKRGVKVYTALPGEELSYRPKGKQGILEEVDITTTFCHSSYNTLQLIVPVSPMRVEPRCSHFRTCGACTMMHINYSNQIQIKQQVLSVFLSAALLNAPRCC